MFYLINLIIFCKYMLILNLKLEQGQHKLLNNPKTPV